MGPGDLLQPANKEHSIERWAKTDMRRGPDFTDITKAFSSLMANPTLLARGGTWNDPQQAQQEATPGYLQARSSVAQNRMTNVANDAALGEAAGTARGQIMALIDQLKAQSTNATGSLFGSLLGGMF